MTGSYQRAGAIAGAALAGLLLASIALWLLQAPGASYRALVLVWLWAIPLLGILGLAGWLLGAAIGKLTGPRSARAGREQRPGHQESG